jgi:hypothetical protein
MSDLAAMLTTTDQNSSAATDYNVRWAARYAPRLADLALP